MNAVDTNILVYSVCADQPKERDAARALLATLDAGNTILLWQVLCEFGAVTSKMSRQGKLDGVSHRDLVVTLRDQFPLVMPSASILDKALHIQHANQVSYWDALLLAACAEAGVRRLYTQDVQSAPIIEGVEIVNPFTPS